MDVGRWGERTLLGLFGSAVPVQHDVDVERQWTTSDNGQQFVEHFVVTVRHVIPDANGGLLRFSAFAARASALRQGGERRIEHLVRAQLGREQALHHQALDERMQYAHEKLRRHGKLP